MSIIRYHKLVRGRIPEIIEASGKTCKTTIKAGGGSNPLPTLLYLHN